MRGRGNHAQNDTYVGTGRGTVDGLLVRHVMEPADCHPIRPGVLFECFVNPDRIDIAADYRLMSACRHKVVEKVSASCAPARRLAARASNWRRESEAIGSEKQAAALSLRCVNLYKRPFGGPGLQPVALQGPRNTQQFSFGRRSAVPTGPQNGCPLQVRKSSIWNGMHLIGPASCEEYESRNWAQLRRRTHKD